MSSTGDNLYPAPRHVAPPAQAAGARRPCPDPAGLAAVNPANPRKRNFRRKFRQETPAYATVANQPLAHTGPLRPKEFPQEIPPRFDPPSPCGFFGAPCGVGPGPCDPSLTGWDPWPAPGCGDGFPIGPPFFPIGGGSGGGSGYAGSQAPSPAPGPCTSPLCSPSNLIGPGGEAGGGVLDIGVIFSVTVEACAPNPECIAAVIAAAPEVGLPVLGAALIYEGVKIGIGIYQARSGANQRENAQAAAALKAIQRICGGSLPPNAKERLHRLIGGQNLTYGQIVQAGVELFCPEKAAPR